MRSWLFTLVVQFFLADALDSAAFQLGALTGAPIPPRFLSFSIEVKSTAEVMLVGGIGGKPRVAMATVFDTLRAAAGDAAGPMIRVGGNSADESVWLPSGALPAGSNYRITSGDLDAWASVAAFNGTLMIDCTLLYGDPASMQKYDVPLVEAAIKRLGWELIEGFELANEPDLFAEKGARPSSYSYAGASRHAFCVLTPAGGD